MGETRIVAEYRELRSSRLWPDQGAPPGHGRPVVLLQGFGVPASTLKPLGRWLAGNGWAVDVAPLGWNVACGQRTVDGVLAYLERHRGPSAPVLVGHSRGGLIARVVAVEQPEAVSMLVTVCTPWTVGPPDRPGVASVTKALRAVRRRGLDVMGSIDCGTGPCCDRFRHTMHEIPRAPWTAIVSDDDDIAGADAQVVGPRATVHIGTTHLGSVLSVAGWTAIGDALRG